MDRHIKAPCMRRSGAKGHSGQQRGCAHSRWQANLSLALTIASVIATMLSVGMQTQSLHFVGRQKQK